MKKGLFSWKTFFSVLFFLIIIAAAMKISSFTNGKYSQEKLTSVENAVKRAAVSCYAVEGIYPPDISYLKQHYGLAVDEKKYSVFYTIYGSNMMPDIDVLPILTQQ